MVARSSGGSAAVSSSAQRPLVAGYAGGRRFRAMLLTVLMVVSLGAAGCSTGGDAETTGKASLVVALDTDVNLLEPHTFRSLAAYAATGGLYAPPLRSVFNEQDGLLVAGDEVTGDLAKSIKVSPDGKTVTLTIAGDAKFENGDPVTAEDMNWTIKRAIEGPGYVAALMPFLGIASADQISVVDDHTLVLKPTVASPLLKKFLTFQVFGALNKKVAEEHATADDPWSFKWYNTHATASGPYQLDSYEQGRQVVLKPNAGYPHASDVANGGVTIRNVPDADQRALLLQRGEIDLATGLPTRQLKQMESDEAIHIYKAPSTRLNYLGMNNTVAPFNNVKVRQAIAYAVPYDALIDQVMSGYASKAGGVVTSPMKTYAGDQVGTYSTDLTKAKQLLQQSGVEVPPVTLTVRQSRSDDQQAAVFIQDNLRKIGVDVKIVKLPDADFSTQLNDKKLQMFIHDWFSWGEDPFYQMQFLMTSKAFTNFSQYMNPQLDALVTKGTFELDAGKRAEISKEAQAILFKDSPIVPLYAPDWVVATRSNVFGVAKDVTQVVRLDTLGKK